MGKQTPLQEVTEVHGGKEKLVETLMGLLDRGEESKDDFRTRLVAMANSKLLRLHRTMTEISQRFTNVDGLVDATLVLMSKAKDKDYREKLLSLTPVRLLGLHVDWQKRAANRKKKVA